MALPRYSMLPRHEGILRLAVSGTVSSVSNVTAETAIRK
jgi:hypothetical protein